MTDAELSDGFWHHMEILYRDGAEFRYVDGALITEWGYQSDEERLNHQES